MPMINGRLYINPGYGQAVESNRIMDAVGSAQPDDDDDESPAKPAAGSFLPNLLNLLIGMFTQPVSVPDYFNTQQQNSPTPQPAQNPYGDRAIMPFSARPHALAPTMDELVLRPNQYGQYPTVQPQLVAMSSDTASVQADPSQSPAPQASGIQSPAPQPSTSDSSNPFGNFGGALQSPPSVDQQQINKLTTHQVGLIVYNETRSLTSDPSEVDSIDEARNNIARVVINGDRLYGDKRPITAGAVEPSPQALQNPAERAAYDSSMAAARSAYLDPNDPTNGAVHFDLHPTDTPYFGNGSTNNPPLSTQQGPFNNSYQGGGLKGSKIYINTYGPDSSGR